MLGLRCSLGITYIELRSGLNEWGLQACIRIRRDERLLDAAAKSPAGAVPSIRTGQRMYPLWFEEKKDR